MRVTLDRNANAAYIKISNNSIKSTKQVSDYCNIDMDEEGKIIGIELLFVAEYSADFKVWLDVAGVAEYLQKSEITIRRWTQAKELPSYKIGGEYRFDIEEIDDYIRRHRYA